MAKRAAGVSGSGASRSQREALPPTLIGVSRQASGIAAIVNANGQLGRKLKKTINENKVATAEHSAAQWQPRPPMDKQSKVSKVLPPLDDPDLPPPPEILPAKPPMGTTVVTWDMQSSSETLTGSIDAIGAYCAHEKVRKEGMFYSRVKLTPGSEDEDSRSRDGSSEFEAEEKDYEQICENERECLQSFVGWLTKVRTDIFGVKPQSKVTRGNSTPDAFDGIVLLSFGAVTSRMPKLMLALRKHKLLPDFMSVVVGVSDLSASSLSGDLSTSLGAISRDVLGVDMPKTDDCAEKSRHLFRLTAGFYGKEELVAHLPPLVKNTFTTAYAVKLAMFRSKTDHRANDLRNIVTTKVGKGVKCKRALIRNIIAIGYDYAALQKQYNLLGSTFREVLLNKLRHMKQHRESSLTDTRQVGCATVVESVMQHFKEIERDFQLRRAPILY